MGSGGPPGQFIFIGSAAPAVAPSWRSREAAAAASAGSEVEKEGKDEVEEEETYGTLRWSLEPGRSRRGRFSFGFRPN